jgi:lysophospholipase L1-like esterase
LKFKRLSILFALVLALSTFFSSSVFAEKDVKPNLVSLGDSITYGWNLEKATDPNNLQQHLKAFPYLVGNGTYTVGKNISGGGWTSENLLTEIQKPENLEAIKNADVITLDIGSNDFLQNPLIQEIRSNPAILQDPVKGPDMQNQLKSAIPSIAGALYGRLGAIIDLIRATNPNNPQIILYNIYNPFANEYAPLHPLGDQFLGDLTVGGQLVPGVNTGVFKKVAMEKHILLADSYTAFNAGLKPDGTSDYIFPKGDVHPTEVGQKVLADLGTQLLSAVPTADISVDLAASTTAETKEPVQVNVSTTAKKVLVVQWLQGSKTVEDFAAAGTDITDNKFQVTENGTYTVYVRDSKGAKAVKSITINNIKKEVTPAPNTGSQNTTPTPTPTTNTGTGSGNPLPDTATPIYNYMAAGLGLVLAGLITLMFRRKVNQ